MLTKDVIQANETLKSLTEEQIAAITTLSQNDENQVIAGKVKEIHDQYDQDIKSITGKDKPGNVKTYDHLKSVLAELKESAEKGPADLQKQLEKLKAEKSDLEQKLKDGKGDEALKTKLADLEKQAGDKEQRIKDLQKQLDTNKTDWQKKVEEAENKAKALRIEHEFDRALTGVKFKDEKIIPETVRSTYVGYAKQKILQDVTPDWIDDGQGGQRLVFRGKDGQVMNNPENKLNPFTAGELLTRELKDIIDAGRAQSGSGTGSGGSGSSGDGTLSLSGVKTQVEATEAIIKHLMSLGVARGTPEFDEKMQKIREDNKIGELPLR